MDTPEEKGSETCGVPEERTGATPSDDGLGIPDFLKIDQVTRKKNWEGVKLTDPLGIIAQDERIKQDRELRQQERKERNAKALAQLKEAHPNERYDRKTKTWVLK